MTALEGPGILPVIPRSPVPRGPHAQPTRPERKGAAAITRPARIYGVLGAFTGFVGVAAGAFGAHALRGSLSPEQLEIFETGARYQLIHAFVLVGVSLLQRRSGQRALGISGALFCVGQFIFPGSLYALALTGTTALGAVTPLGGLCYLGGWLALGVAVWRGEVRAR